MNTPEVLSDVLCVADASFNAGVAFGTLCTVVVVIVVTLWRSR